MLSIFIPLLPERYSRVTRKLNRDLMFMRSGGRDLFTSTIECQQLALVTGPVIKTHLGPELIIVNSFNKARLHDYLGFFVSLTSSIANKY